MKGKRERGCVLKLRVCAMEAVILREQAEDFSVVLQVFIHCSYSCGQPNTTIFLVKLCGLG
jgi:hypothetical protein